MSILTTLTDKLTAKAAGGREILIGLEIAAALGPKVVAEEWEQVCRSSDAQASNAAIDELISLGFARGETEGWSFISTPLVEALAQRARDNGRWRAHHAGCAQVLLSLYPKGSPGIAARSAAHMVSARNYEGALPLLLDAEQEAFVRGHYETCSGLLDQRNEVLDKLDIGEGEAERAQNRWRRGRLHFVNGEHQRAQSLVEKSLCVLRKTGWAGDCGLAALLLGRILRANGQLELARESFDEAIRLLALAGDERGLAISRASQGYIDMYEGRYQRARQGFLRSLEVFESLGNEAMVAKLATFIAQTYLVDDDHDQATRFAERARRIARRTGDSLSEADAESCMGEIARSRGQLDRARSCYASAAELYDEIGNRSLYVCHLNMAMVEIAASDFAAARDILEGLESVISSSFKALLPLLSGGLMTCAAAEANWPRFEHFESLVYDATEHGTRFYPDVATLARTTSRLADTHGNADVAQRMLSFACQQLEGLGKNARAERLRAQKERP